MQIRNAKLTPDGLATDCEVEHPEFGWVPFTASADDTSEFAQLVIAAIAKLEVAPSGPSAEQLRAIGYDKVCAAIASAAGAFTANLPQETIAAWSTKAAAARSHTAATPSTLIIAEAEVAGIEPDVLVGRILAKADIYETTIARLDGLRSAAWTGLEAAANAADVELVVADMTERLATIIAAVPAP